MMCSTHFRVPPMLHRLAVLSCFIIIFADRTPNCLADCHGVSSIFSCLSSIRNTYSVGSSVTLTISTSLSTVAGHIYSWKFNNTLITRAQFDGTTFTLLPEPAYASRIVPSFADTGADWDLTITISGIQESENNAIVTVVSPVATVSNEFELNIIYCSAESLPTGALVPQSDCGYLDICILSCSSDYVVQTVQAQCLSDATWNNTIACTGCSITNNCTNCGINGTAAIAVGETKAATCQKEFGSPNDPQTLICDSTGDTLIFNLHCERQCSVVSTCTNCEFQGGLTSPTTINNSESMTAICKGASVSADDPQTKMCTNGTTITFDLNCTVVATAETTTSNEEITDSARNTVLTSVAGSFTTLPSITNGTAAGSVTIGTAVVTTGYNIAYNTTIANESGTQAASSFVTPTDMAIQTTVDMLNTTLMEMSDPNDLETAQTTTSHALVASKPSLESTAFRSVTTTAAMTQAIYNASSPSTSRSINRTSSQTEGNSSFQAEATSANTISSSTNTTVMVTTSIPQDSGLPAYAIALIAVGCVLVVGGVAGGVYMFNKFQTKTEIKGTIRASNEQPASANTEPRNGKPTNSAGEESHSLTGIRSN